MKKTKQTKTFGEFLKRCRVEKGLTQKQAGLKLGYTCGQYVSNIERGETVPRKEVVKRFLKVYGVKDSVQWVG